MTSRKRKSTKKVQPPKETNSSVIETAPFHLTFPITLIHKEGTSVKYCYFQVEEHLKKYLERLKLKPKDCKIEQTKPRQSSTT